MFFRQGRGEVMHDFRDYRVRGSTLLFLTPGQIHSIQPTAGFGGIIISFSQSFFDHKSPPPSELLDLPFFFPVDSAPILPIPDGDGFRIGQAFAEIQREFAWAGRPVRIGGGICWRSRIYLLRPPQELLEPATIDLETGLLQRGLAEKVQGKW